MTAIGLPSLPRRISGRLLDPRSVVGWLLRNPVGALSLTFIGLLTVVALLAPVVAPQDPNSQVLLDRLQGPSGEHLLGTDALGRDILSRLIFSARVTMVASVQALGLAAGVGIPLGLIAGYIGGWVDAIIARAADSLLALPPLVLAIAIIGALGPGLTNAMIGIGVVFAPRFLRIARASTQSVREESFIEAARVVGCSTPRILLRHLLRNVSGPLLVQASVMAGLVLIAEASLSFLGLGVQPPDASWGSMARSGFDSVYNSTWPVFPPLFMIVATILAWSLLGDALRDALGRGGARR